MQLKVFAIDAQGGGEAGEELNRFLRGHRVVAVKRRLVEQANGAYWTFCVEYLERAGTTGGPGTADRAKRGVDYKEILSAEDFAVFAKLRDLRKEMAEKEGVPPYAVFTNEQLAAMVTGRMEAGTTTRPTHAAQTATTTRPTQTTTTDSTWPEFNPDGKECRRPEADPATVPPAPPRAPWQRKRPPGAGKRGGCLVERSGWVSCCIGNPQPVFAAGFLPSCPRC